jgi:hypothetical protein
MEAINIFDKRTLPTNEIVAKTIRDLSLRQVKYIRFDYGCPLPTTKIKELLRLHRFACNSICYLNDEEISLIREEVIKNSILHINEL